MSSYLLPAMIKPNVNGYKKRGGSPDDRSPKTDGIGPAVLGGSSSSLARPFIQPKKKWVNLCKDQQIHQYNQRCGTTNTLQHYKYHTKIGFNAWNEFYIDFFVVKINF